MTREEVLERYRSYRKACTKLQTAAICKLPTKALLAAFKQLGLSDGRNLWTDSEEELVLGYDLALHTAPPGRSLAIERYAKTFVSEDLDEIGVMRALCKSAFSIWRIVRRHEVAGLVVEDLLRGGEHWLVDEALEETAPLNTAAAMRLVQPDEFVINCGVIVPLQPEEAMGIVGSVINDLPEEQWEGALWRLANSTRLPRMVYNFALDTGVTDATGYV